MKFNNRLFNGFRAFAEYFDVIAAVGFLFKGVFLILAQQMAYGLLDLMIAMYFINSFKTGRIERRLRTVERITLNNHETLIDVVEHIMEQNKEDEKTEISQ